MGIHPMQSIWEKRPSHFEIRSEWTEKGVCSIVPPRVTRSKAVEAKAKAKDNSQMDVKTGGKRAV
jgi:hypothetical protein